MSLQELLLQQDEDLAQKAKCIADLALIESRITSRKMRIDREMQFSRPEPSGVQPRNNCDADMADIARFIVANRDKLEKVDHDFLEVAWRPSSEVEIYLEETRGNINKKCRAGKLKSKRNSKGEWIVSTLFIVNKIINGETQEE